MIGLYLLIGLGCFLMLIGKKSVHSKISINATPNQVWDVITNTAQYNEWNSVMLLLEGSIKKNLVKYRFTQEEGKQYDIPGRIEKNYSFVSTKSRRRNIWDNYF